MKSTPALLALLFAFAPATGLSAQNPQVVSLDAFIRAQMARRQIAGLSLAIVDSGRIVLTRGYGMSDLTTRSPVTTSTLFQAGSISKPVSALGALRLVQSKKIGLDEPVNSKLTSWKVPENGFTSSEKVTLRRLLSHTAGMTVHGFPGYARSDSFPTLIQVLNGIHPANTEPIRVDTTPGAIWRYSGGGFTVMQQLVIDLTGTPFPRFMQQSVLGPIGMTQSSFEQPLPPARAALTATGYYADRTPVAGRSHLYPEMAAAGLWTTAADLARFVVEIQQTAKGKGRGVISPAMLGQYLTEQKNNYGLGIAVQGSGPAFRFSHNGRDEGFDAFLYADTLGHGLVIMINANDNSRLMGRIMNHVAQSRQWPEATWMYSSPSASRGVAVEPTRLARLSGWYETAENQMAAIAAAPNGSGVMTIADGQPDEIFLALDTVRFGSDERDFKVAFATDGQGEATAALWRHGEPNQRNLPRVAPLPSTRQPVADTDTALTNRVVEALKALQQSGAALADAPGITAGAKKDFAGGVGNTFEGWKLPLIYLGEEDVSRRGIHRHGGTVTRVRYYQITLGAGQQYLLAHLTADGLLTDYDVVDR